MKAISMGKLFHRMQTVGRREYIEIYESKCLFTASFPSMVLVEVNRGLEAEFMWRTTKIYGDLGLVTAVMITPRARTR
jgi:hypothetical protein